MDMPERIWAWEPKRSATGGWATKEPHPINKPVQYVRADLALTWRPIETAPKDGSRFIGARWVDVASEWVSAETYWEAGMKTPRFIFNGWSRREPPTHWMPPPPYQVEAMQQAVQRIKGKLRADDTSSTVEG